LFVVLLSSADIEIDWRLPSGVSVSRRKIDLESSRLTLTDLRLTDAGQYVCVGNNALGRTEFTFQLVIHGTSSITIASVVDSIRHLLYAPVLIRSSL